jgi:hypothetical protein
LRRKKKPENQSIADFKKREFSFGFSCISLGNDFLDDYAREINRTSSLTFAKALLSTLAAVYLNFFRYFCFVSIQSLIIAIHLGMEVYYIKPLKTKNGTEE